MAALVICCRGKAEAFLSWKTWHAVISEACCYPTPTDRWPERGTSRLPLGRQSLGTRCQYSSRQLWCRGMPGQSGWQGQRERERWSGRVTHIMRLGCERAKHLVILQWYMPDAWIPVRILRGLPLLCLHTEGIKSIFHSDSPPCLNLKPHLDVRNFITLKRRRME